MLTQSLNHLESSVDGINFQFTGPGKLKVRLDTNLREILKYFPEAELRLTATTMWSVSTTCPLFMVIFRLEESPLVTAFTVLLGRTVTPLSSIWISLSGQEHLATM